MGGGGGGGGGWDRDTYNVTNLREVGGHLRSGDLQPVRRPVGSVVDHFDLEDSKEREVGQLPKWLSSLAAASHPAGQLLLLHEN